MRFSGGKGEYWPEDAVPVPEAPAQDIELPIPGAPGAQEVLEAPIDVCGWITSPYMSVTSCCLYSDFIS